MSDWYQKYELQISDNTTNIVYQQYLQKPVAAPNIEKKRIKIKIIELVKGKHEVIDELRNYIQENSFFRFILKTLVLVQECGTTHFLRFLYAL